MRFLYPLPLCQCEKLKKYLVVHQQCSKGEKEFIVKSFVALDQNTHTDEENCKSNKKLLKIGSMIVGLTVL